MADTPRNQEAYPQNPTQKPGIGFPIARFVSVISLATAWVIDCAITTHKGKETGETALFRQLIGCLVKGDVVVADRYLWQLLDDRLFDAGRGRCLGRRSIGRCENLLDGCGLLSSVWRARWS